MYPNLVFVYGTLKREGHPCLGNSVFLSDAVTKYDYCLYGANPRIPVLLMNGPDGTRKKVKGKLFRVTDGIDWPSLDRLEGFPYGYQKGAIEVRLVEENRTAFAWVYFMDYQNLNPPESRLCETNEQGEYEW